MLFRADINFLPAATSHAARGLWLGIILSLMPLAQFFGAPILGTLSDRFGRKKLLLASIALGVVGYSVALSGVLLQNIWLLGLSRLLIGFAAGNEAVGSAAIADVSTPEEKAKHFGLLHMAAGTGFAVGPFLGGKLSTMSIGMFSGYAVPFVCAAIMDTINFISVALVFKETCTTPNKNSVLSFGIKNLKKAWVLPGFFLFFLAVFCYNFGWSFYWEFIPTHWITSYNFTVEMVGNRYAWGAAWYALSAGLLIRPLVNRFKTETILYYALMLCALSIGIHLIATAEWIYWLCIPAQQFLMALIFPATSAIISNHSSDKAQGEMMGILQSVQSIALIASPLIAGPLLGLSVQMPIVLGACMLFIAGLILRRSTLVLS
jgi:DHA1 family tetracycline resistance protein-like MFS transporter